MRIPRTTIFLALAVIGSSRAGIAQAQPVGNPLTLQQAVALALQQSPDRRAAALDVEAAAVNERLAQSALLPALSFTETASRGNDPVYAFGTRLRQHRFTQNDFDLNALNRPTPVGNFATRFTGDWVAFDSWKTEFVIRGAQRQTLAMRSAVTRADQEIVHRVVVGREGVLIARKQLEVAHHQVETAQALVDSSKSRVSAGLAVDSDELSAMANLSARQQEEIAAEGELEIAWAELERATGSSIPESARQLPDLQPAPFQTAALNESIDLALQARPDRKSLEQAAAASHSAVLAARANFAPSLHAFGDWEQDRDSFAGSGGNNWLAGIGMSFDILPVVKRQQLAAARIAEERSHAVTRSADEQIRLEVTRAWYVQRAAAQMVQVAEAARAQTGESLRILRNRYGAGLATMTDLLRGEDAERQTEANYWASVSRSRIAWCDLKFALGTLDARNVSDFE